MKKKYCFLVDTSADPSILKLDPNIFVMPFGIVVTQNKIEKIYTDWGDISRDEVLKMLDAGADLKTSQPSIGYIETKLEELLEDYEWVICLTISKHFSGTYNSTCSAKKDLEKKHGKNRILVADTRSVSFLQNELLLYIKTMIDKGDNLSTIEKNIKNYSDSYCGFTCVTNATQLVKGGRLTGLKALLVKALSLKLVIKFQGGKLDFFDKSTNLSAALDKGLKMVEKELDFDKHKIKRVYIFSDLNAADTEKYSKCVREKLSDLYHDKYVVGTFPTAIVAHLGNHSFSVIIQL